MLGGDPAPTTATGLSAVAPAIGVVAVGRSRVTGRGRRRRSSDDPGVGSVTALPHQRGCVGEVDRPRSCGRRRRVGDREVELGGRHRGLR